MPSKKHCKRSPYHTLTFLDCVRQFLKKLKGIVEKPKDKENKKRLQKYHYIQQNYCVNSKHINTTLPHYLTYNCNNIPKGKYTDTVLICK